MAVLGGDLACLGGGGGAGPAGDAGGGEGDPARAAAALPGGGPALRHRLDLRRLDRLPGVRLGELRRGQRLGLRGTDADRRRARIALQPRTRGRRSGSASGSTPTATARPTSTTRPTRSSPPRTSCASSCTRRRRAAPMPPTARPPATTTAPARDGVADYADEVMARAVSYGFRGKGSPRPSEPVAAQPSGEEQGPVCAASDQRRLWQRDRADRREPARPHARARPAPTAPPTAPASNGARSSSPGSGSGPGCRCAGGTAPYAYSGSIYEWAKAHEAGVGPAADGDAGSRRCGPLRQRDPPTAPTSASSSASSRAGRS